MKSELAISASTDNRRWTHLLRTYHEADHLRSIQEIVVTGVPFLGLWCLAWWSLGLSYWLTLLIAVPAAAFLVRLFMIQHDCGHGAFFRRRSANDWLGRALGVLTLTPYDHWRESHAVHHATSGHLGRRGIGDIDTLTVCEYSGLSRWQRLRYRLYRSPFVMFGIGPAYLFLIKNRLPLGGRGPHWRGWCSTMATNGGMALLILAGMWLVGIGSFLLVHLPITLLASSIGVWLFYVQHQFEETFWARDGWNMQDAALRGSSHYDLPVVLQWLTANIGIHHVHHLSSRIPFYRLSQVLRDHPDLRKGSRLTLLKSFECVRLSLWDESQRRMISFRELGRRNSSPY
jgi:omega-6 fatty acid desaturase (delta-12 desaturase)